MNESHQVLIDKILASDGAMVINKEGNIIFESVFTVVSWAPKGQLRVQFPQETVNRAADED